MQRPQRQPLQAGNTRPPVNPRMNVALSTSMSQRRPQGQVQVRGIYKLPPEVLSKVFIACLPSQPVGINSAEAPLLLLRVSRLWRTLAFDIPVLWTTIDFTYPFRLDGPDTFRKFLKHSKSLPITFIFETDDYRNPSTELTVMRILLSNLPRFKALRGSFGEKFWNAINEYADAHPGDLQAPSLEEFEVCDRAPPDDDDFSLMDMISAPRLQRLVLRGPWTFMTIIRFRPERLQEFSLTDVEFEVPAISGDDLMSILRSCSDLRMLDLEVCEEVCPRSAEILRERTPLPQLRRLTLCLVPDCPQAAEFIRCFRLPNLRELVLHSHTLLSPEWINTALSELHSPNLRALTIGGFDFTTYTDVRNLALWSYTNLQSLEFRRTRISSALLRHLLPPRRPSTSAAAPVPALRTQDWPLPNLRRLSLNNSSVPTWEEVLLVVQKRAAPLFPPSTSRGATSSSSTHAPIPPGCICEFVVHEEPVYTFKREYRQVLEQVRRLSRGRFEYWVTREQNAEV